MLMVVLLYVLAGAPLTGTADVSSVVVSSMKELSTLAAPRSGVVIILAVRSRPRVHAARLYHSIRTVASYSYASPCSVSQCSHCLRSRPATPTAVFATAPAPEAANDSAIAASARRSSAEGSVADATR